MDASKYWFEETLDMIVLCFGLKLCQKALFYKALAAHIAVFFENSYFFQGHLLPLTTSRAAESLRRAWGETTGRHRPMWVPSWMLFCHFGSPSGLKKHVGTNLLRMIWILIQSRLVEFRVSFGVSSSRLDVCLSRKTGFKSWDFEQGIYTGCHIHIIV